jgi:hypothetical protein
VLRKNDARSFRRHLLAMKATRSNLTHLDQRLAQLAECYRSIMKDRRFVALLRAQGFKAIPKPIHDCLK